MSQEILIALTGILFLGVTMQWVAWRLRLPSIFVLLLCGLALGPGLRLLDPDALLGDLLLPLVSLSVAVILFEGGMNLRLIEIRDVGRVVWNLVTVGCLITWFIASTGAHYILGFTWGISFLFGALLVVTGPTVTIPLIRHIRPIGRIGPIAKWEGIVNDPIGAVLALLVYEAIRVGLRGPGTLQVLGSLFQTAAVGGMVGLAATGAMIVMLKPARLPDYLHMHASLALVLLAYTVSNVLQSESGLVAVTVMGIAMANQRRVTVRHLMEFKENLRVLLLSVLFIVLAARLAREDIASLRWGPSAVYLGLLAVVARPLAVAASTWRTRLNFRERVFLACLAPRGVVAAAVASVFALELAEIEHPQANMLVPYTFLVVIGTVALYGLAASPVARRLGLGQPNPQGALIVGAHSWAREIGHALKSEGFAVRLVDTNWTNVASARLEGLSAHYGSAISETAAEEIDLGGMGRLLALTSNDEANALAALHFSEVFGRAEVYQLAAGEHRSRPDGEFSPMHLRGRTLFGKGVTYDSLSKRFREGAALRRVVLTREFDYEAFVKHYGEKALPLFLVTEGGQLQVFNVDRPPTPRLGQRVISLVDAGVQGPGELVEKPGACAVGA